MRLFTITTNDWFARAKGRGNHIDGGGNGTEEYVRAYDSISKVDSVCVCVCNSWHLFFRFSLYSFQKVDVEVLSLCSCQRIPDLDVKVDHW